MNLHTFFRSFKGAPLSILMCFILFKDDHTCIFNEKFFSDITGYSSNTIRKGLDFLLINKFVFRLSRYGGYSLDFSKVYFLFNTTTAFNCNNKDISEHDSSGEAVFNNRASKFDAPSPSLYYNYSQDNINFTVRDFLLSSGIGEPMCSFLSSLKHLSLEYAKHHIDFGLSKGDSLGLIIHRMRHADPDPVLSSDPVRKYKTYWGLD